MASLTSLQGLGRRAGVGVVRGLSNAAVETISEASVRPRAYGGSRSEWIPVKALASMEYDEVKLENWRQRSSPDTHNPGKQLILRPFDPKTEACLRRALGPVARELNLKVGYDHKEKAIRISPLQASWKDDKKAAKGWANRPKKAGGRLNTGDLELELMDLHEIAEAERHEDDAIFTGVAELSADEYSLQEERLGALAYQGEAVNDNAADDEDMPVVTVANLYSSPYEAVSLKKLAKLQQKSDGKERTLRELLHQLSAGGAEA